MGVEIIASAALDAVNEYRASKRQPRQWKSIPLHLDTVPFSPEAFIKALIAFIAATDQVSYMIFLCVHSDNYL